MKQKDDPAAAAKATFDALSADDDKVLPLATNKIMGAIADALPDKPAAAAHRKLSGRAPRERGTSRQPCPFIG